MEALLLSFQEINARAASLREEKNIAALAVLGRQNGVPSVRISEYVRGLVPMLIEEPEEAGFTPCDDDLPEEWKVKSAESPLSSMAEDEPYDEEAEYIAEAEEETEAEAAVVDIPPTPVNIAPEPDPTPVNDAAPSAEVAEPAVVTEAPKAADEPGSSAEPAAEEATVASEAEPPKPDAPAKDAPEKEASAKEPETDAEKTPESKTGSKVLDYLLGINEPRSDWTSAGAKVIWKEYNASVALNPYRQGFPLRALAEYICKKCDADSDFEAVIINDRHTFTDLIRNYLVPALQKYNDAKKAASGEKKMPEAEYEKEVKFADNSGRSAECVALSDEDTYRLIDEYFAKPFDSHLKARKAIAAAAEKERKAKSAEAEKKRKETAAKKAAAKTGAATEAAAPAKGEKKPDDGQLTLF